MALVDIGTPDQIPEGKGKAFQTPTIRIAIFRHEGSFYALEDRCTHADLPLVDGWLEDGCVVCPWHAAQFDLKTGEALTPPATGCTKTFDVIEKDGQLFVEIPVDT